MNRRDTTKYAQKGAVNTTRACPACVMLKPPHLLSTHGHQAGFTVVEVLVAVVVFAVGLVAIAGMQTHSISQSTSSDQMSMRINAITHQAETLIRLPVMTDTTNNITVNPIFEEANMCKYGADTCEWAYVENEGKKPYTVRQRVTQGYPMPDLAMVELEVAANNISETRTQRRTVRIAYVRSLRWN